MASFGSRLRNDLAQEADEASATLERISAEESRRELKILPDAWSDDAQTGHDLKPVAELKPVQDQPSHNQSLLDQSTQDQSVVDQSCHDQSRYQQPVIPEQNFENIVARKGPGYQIISTSLGPPLVHNELPKGIKRKYYVKDNIGHAFMLAEEEDVLVDGKPKKIPRPPNAFMLYANEYRRILARDNPNESNKEISVRLGTMWKTMSKPVKERYFEMARVVDAEHKKKYPNYVYNPKEARMRKAIRDQTREHNRSGGSGKSPSPSKRPSSVSSQGSAKSGMGSVRILDGKGGTKAGYMPLYPQGWGDQSQQYVVPENFMDISYQNHDPASVYSNMMPAAWYPYYMQQENGAAYGQSWQPHAAPNYLQQQQQQQQQHHQQRMQQMQAQAQAQAQAQGAPASGYMMPFEAPAQQSIPAKPPGPAKQNKTSSEELPTQTSNPNQTATVTYSEASTTSAKPSQNPSQEHAYSTPQMSPTKAYHKYLQGNELSPPTNWPSLYLYPTPDKTTANPQQPPSAPEKGYGYYPEVAGPQFTYYDYIVPNLDFMPRGPGDMRNMPYPPGGFVNQMFPQMAKMSEYSMGFRQMMPPSAMQHPGQKCENKEEPKENLLQADKEASLVEQEYTVMLSVMDQKQPGVSDARVIATYEGEHGSANKSEVDKGLKGLELEEDPMKVNDTDCDLGNSTFSFMQDPMYKTILKSIEPNDNQKIIQENKNVCVMTNDPFDGGQMNPYSCLNSRKTE